MAERVDLEELGISEDRVATKEDLQVQRDEDGELLPVVTPIPGMDKSVVHYPITRGGRNELIPSSMQLDQMTNAQMAKLLREYCIRPDFSDIEPEDVNDDDWKAFVDAETIVEVICEGSGYRVVEAQASRRMAMFQQSQVSGITDKVMEKLDEHFDNDSTDE